MLSSTLNLNGRLAMHSRQYIESHPDLFADKSVIANPRKFAATLERSAYEFVYRSRIVPETNQRASVYVYVDGSHDIQEPAPHQDVSGNHKRKREEPNETTQGLREFAIGDISVEFRSDGYVNATKMCKDGGKEWSSYARNITTVAFFKALSSSLEISRELLMSYQHAGPYETRGTFVHPDIAINLAQWISPELGQAMLDHLRPTTTVQQGPFKENSEIGHMVLTLGNMTVQFREDGYVNATKLCKDGGKEWKNYMRNDTAKAFVETLRSSAHIRAELLITYQHDGPYETRGTFVHPDIAINLAQWISPAFAVAVSQLVRRYATGKVTTRESKQMALDIQNATRPVDINKKASRPVDINKKASQPVDINKKASQPVDINKKASQPVDINKKATQPNNALPSDTRRKDQDVFDRTLEIMALQARLEQQILRSQLEKQTLEAKIETDALIAKINVESAKADLTKQRLEFETHTARHNQALAEMRTEFLIALWRCRRS